jgi:cardiolipin synthase
MEKALVPIKPSNFTLANQITVARILMVPLIAIGLLKGNPPWVQYLLLFTLITDALDGLAARVFRAKTQLGAFLDPMADKLLMTTLFLIFMYKDLVDSWVFVVIFSRELLIVLGWFVIFILTGNKSIRPRLLGRAATAAQSAAAFAYIVNVPDSFQQALLWFAIAVTVVSAIDYIIVGERQLGGIR